MRFSRILFRVAIAVGVAIVPTARLSSDQAPPVNVPGIDKPVIVVTGEVTGNETWVSSNYYVLRGAVFVRAGATLNIAAGTRIIGEAGSVGTLIVEQGGRLNAIGTAAAPIVFTSDQPIGQRGRGDWGGIIINGRAPLNFGSGQAAGEGDTGVYGGNDPNDNSGTLQYVRVEFSGVEFSPDNELNGIAFQAVGRGTVVHHVQAHMSRDDAMEWFGGTVDGKYLVMSNAADDSVDWTFGWTGRLQFVAVTQRGDDADNGIEADNNEFNNNVLPRSNPQIYNITVCGDPDRNEGGESPRGANLRRGTAFTIRNFLLTGFKTTGFQISDGATVTQVENGTSQMGAGVAWNMGVTGRRSRRADALERAALHQQRPLPGHPNERRSRSLDGGLLEPRSAELPTLVDRDTGRRSAGAHPAAERRVFRSHDLHWCRAAGSSPELDGWLDVVPSELDVRSRGRAASARMILAHSPRGRDGSPLVYFERK